MAANFSRSQGYSQDSDPLSAAGFSLGFETIPPERIGLNGEYDHDGLAKRCQLALETRFQPAEIQNLSVYQRGAVILLVGEVPSQLLLHQIVATVMETHGAQYVEMNGVSVVPTAVRLSYI